MSQPRDPAPWSGDPFVANLAIVRRYREDPAFQRECAERAARFRGDLVPGAAAAVVRSAGDRRAPFAGAVNDDAVERGAERRRARLAHLAAEMQRDVEHAAD